MPIALLYLVLTSAISSAFCMLRMLPFSSLDFWIQGRKTSLTCGCVSKRLFVPRSLGFPLSVFNVDISNLPSRAPFSFCTMSARWAQSLQQALPRTWASRPRQVSAPSAQCRTWPSRLASQEREARRAEGLPLATKVSSRKLQEDKKMGRSRR